MTSFCVYVSLLLLSFVLSISPSAFNAEPSTAFFSAAQPKPLPFPTAVPTPPTTPSLFTASVFIYLLPGHVEEGMHALHIPGKYLETDVLPLASRVYFDYSTQKRRMDVTILGEVVSTFSFFQIVRFRCLHKEF